MHPLSSAAPPPEPSPRRRRLAELGRWVEFRPGGLVMLALLVGTGAGAGAVLFRYLILGFTEVFTGHRDYSAAPHTANGLVPSLGMWFVLVVPVVGGLLYGPVVHFFAREARGHGVPEVMYAVADQGGRIRPRVAIVKSLASAICIGAGGSVGREGPIVQIGSALGSTAGQLSRASESRLRILVACGAAGGISATFNAPIAGVFFALELILRDFEAASFGVVVLASFAADVIGRAAFGPKPFLALPAFQINSPLEYPLYAGLGLVAALVGIAFIRVLYGSEDLADRLWRGPEWLRPAAGGVLLGLVLLALPQLYGVGYPPLEHAVQGRYVIGFLLLLLVGKIVATSLTLAIGGSGGVFAPSLFMGAMLGSAYGATLHDVLPGGIVAGAGAYGLVGMGAVFAAAARAPITAVIIIFELTGDYRIILPLMLAIAVATGLSHLLSPETIYTLKLKRRGVDLVLGRRPNLMRVLRVSDAMHPVGSVIEEDASIDDARATLSRTRRDELAVVDEEGRYRGVVTARAIEDRLTADRPDTAVRDVTEVLPPLRPGQTLEVALGFLLGDRCDGLPVVDDDDEHVIGWLDHLDLLQCYQQRLESDAGTRRPSPLEPAPAASEPDRLAARVG